MNDYKPSSQIASKTKSTSQKVLGFKPLDLTIAYHALIKAFIQSDEVSITETEIETHEEQVYDNS